MKYEEMKQVESVRLLIYGEPLTGKSTLVAKLAEEGYNILWICLDRGYQGIPDKLSPAARERLNFIVVEDTEDSPACYLTTLKLFYGDGPKNVCQRHGRVDCAACSKEGGMFETWDLNALDGTWIVFVDHLTRIMNSLTYAIAKTSAAALTEKEADSTKNFKDPDKYRFTIGDWGNLGKYQEKLLKKIEAARCNVICAAHVTEATFDDKTKKITPYFGTVNFSGTVAGYFNHVVYCSILNREHKYGSSTGYSIGA